MLNLGYTLLHNHLYAAISVVGLDPYQGFFHQRKHGHAALASDLVEEWRAVVVDSIVLTLINRREIGADDFHRTHQGLRLTKPALGRFLARYDARVSELVTAPGATERTSYQRRFELQARQLGKVVMEEKRAYESFRVG